MTHSKQELENGLRNVITSLFGAFQQEKFDKFKDLLPIDDLDLLNTSVSRLWFKIKPFNDYIEVLISNSAKDISENKKDDLIELISNQSFYKNHFEFWIKRIEGSACCADKSGHILNQIKKYLLTSNPIELSKSEEDYWVPKKVFTNHEDIIEFFTSLKVFKYGDPSDYFKCVQKYTIILKNQNQ